jgi:peptide-methionine (S)-S-oxide reductase
MANSTNNSQVAVFGGGCFWCTEAVFQKVVGVSNVVSGYAGGKIENPTYEKISMGTTGHAEVIHITFDPQAVSYDQLLDVFFATHDPTTLNQQGYDKGTQYRSVVFTTTDEQLVIVHQKIKQLEASGEFSNPIVTEVHPLETFFTAEEYHQNYYTQNQFQPYCQIVINPKLETLFATFPNLVAKK